MKPIYIFCPHYIRTGGPEALHQLSDALIEQGFDARLVYFNKEDITGIGHDAAGNVQEWLGIPREFPAYDCSAPEYAGYKTHVTSTIDCSEPCVVVLPETLAHMTALFSDHVTVLIWWLSVDNAFGALAKINLNHLRKPNVVHAPQSSYASRVLDALGLISAGPLSDYTVDLTSYAQPMAWAERPKLAVFNANQKVIADLDAMFAAVRALDPEIVCQRLPHMPRADLAQCFATARLYVDLGTFPGKDRGPREALSMGCCALVAHVGAASETGAFMCGGDGAESVAENISMLINSEPRFFAGDERAIFFKEVRDVFSAL